MYTFDQFFGSKSQHLHNKTVDSFFHQIVLHSLCKLVVQWHPMYA